jgi:regulator of ribonuclease activity A
MRWIRLGGRAAFHGRVATVRCREAAGLVRQCIDEPGGGRVLVVDGAGSLEAALVGDRMAAVALRNGWSGILVHGAVRDADALRDLEIGLYALGTVPRRASGEASGERNMPLLLGQLQVRPGDYLFCDPDGLVVCDADSALPLLG